MGRAVTPSACTRQYCPHQQQAAIAWLDENEAWHKALLMCDCKSLVDAVGNLLAPDEGIRLVQAAVARLNAER